MGSLEAGTEKVADKCAHEEQTSARDARSRRSALLRSRHLALFDPMPNEAGEGGGVVGVESIFIVSDPSSGFDSTIPLLSPPDFGLSVIETQRG